MRFYCKNIYTIRFGAEKGTKCILAFTNNILNWKIHHELLVIDRRKQRLTGWEKRLEQMKYDLTTREGRLLESEPYLRLAKKLQEMELTLEDCLPWFETINEVAQMQNMDIRDAAIFVTQQLREHRQFGGIQRQIEIAQGQLKMLNTISAQKEQALSILKDLSDRGVTESQILQLISFASEWDGYWHPPTNGNLQQRNNQCPGSSNPGSSPPLVNGNNGYGGDLSQTDQIKLNLLRTTTTNILNRMGAKN